MDSNSVNKRTHDFPHGNERKKPSIPLKELVMEALLSASSTGMVVSEIYEFINGRCKEYDLAENKWKINVRNMLTTSVYFHCFSRKERDGRRGRCWKFNVDAYNLHLQMKGNREPSTSKPTEDIRRNFLGKRISEIQPADPASFNNFNDSIFAFNPSQTGWQPTALSRIHPTHQDNAWPSSDIIAAIRPQPVQMSSMHNQCSTHPIQMQQTRYSNGTDFTNTVHANLVDQYLHPNVQQAHFSGDSVKAIRRNYVNRFVPYDVRDSRNYTHLVNTIPTPGRKQDTCSTQQHYIQHSTQSYSLSSVNSQNDSSWMAQAYPPIDSGDNYFPQNLYSQTQLKSTDPYLYGVSQETMTYSDRTYAYQ